MAEMIKRLGNLLTVAALLFFLALLVFAIPSFFDPTFEIVNDSGQTVSVTAKWRDKEKNVGPIPAMSSTEFSIDDEAGIRFIIRYADRRELETEPMYFTRGLRLIARVSDSDVEVRYDHDR